MSSLVLAIALVACSGDTGTPAGGGAASGEQATAVDDVGTVLARVGDVVVGSKEFEMAAARATPENGDSLTIEEKKKILDELVAEKALYLQAKKMGIDRDPKVQKVMINTLLRQEVYGNVRNGDFSTEDLQKYFDEHHEEFVVPEKIQVKRIFIRQGEERSADEARKIAEDVRKEAQGDAEKFKDLAAKYSEDPYRRRGGDLGFVARAGKPGVPQEVIDMAFTLGVGQVSEVFEAGGGQNVVMVANKREKVERTFEQMRGSVLRKVKNDRYKQLYDDYVATVRKDVPVSVDEAALAAVQVEQAKRLQMGPPGADPLELRDRLMRKDGEEDGIEPPAGGDGDE